MLHTSSKLDFVTRVQRVFGQFGMFDTTAHTREIGGPFPALAINSCCRACHQALS